VPAAPAWVSYAALIVSLLALVVSIVVAGWNVYTWRSAGPRLTLVAHDRPPMYPPDSEDRPLESWLLVIECHNDGRTSTKVHKLRLRGTDGSSVTCQRTDNSDPVPVDVPGKNMATWIISASTLKNIGLPRTDDGALVLEPEVTWGAGKVLTGNQVALMLPADGQVPFPNAKVGTPSVRVEQPPADDQP
jgi:hypothetical protein